MDTSICSEQFLTRSGARKGVVLAGGPAQDGHHPFDCCSVSNNLGSSVGTTAETGRARPRSISRCEGSKPIYAVNCLRARLIAEQPFRFTTPLRPWAYVEAISDGQCCLRIPEIVNYVSSDDLDCWESQHNGMRHGSGPAVGSLTQMRQRRATPVSVASNCAQVLTPNSFSQEI